MAFNFSLGVIVLFCFYAQPTFARGDYYVDTTSAAALNTNSCRTTNDPCLTMSGVLTIILNSATPKNSTVHITGTVMEEVSITDPDLNGLTLTWNEKGNRPVIDATGNQYAIYINNVNNVRIQHIDIQGPEYAGIYVYGSQDTHLTGLVLNDNLIKNFTGNSNSRYGIYNVYSDHAKIKNNEIQNIGQNYLDTGIGLSASGIYSIYSDHLVVRNNLIDGLQAIYTANANANTVYIYTYGISVYEADDVIIKQNRVRSLGSTVTQSTASTYGNIYANGLYVYNISDGLITHNQVIDLNGSVSVSANDTTAYGSVYGLYGGNLYKVTIDNNIIRNFTMSGQVQDTEYLSPGLYGMYLNGGDNVSLNANTVESGTITKINGQGTSLMYAYSINDVGQLDITRNTAKNTTAINNGSGNASSTALYLSDTPDANIYRNRLANFTASATNDGVMTSAGIDIHYNATADIVNNVIYYSTPAISGDVDGIVLNSEQSTPIRAYHNTLSNLGTCVDINEMIDAEFLNNVCYLNTAGGFVYEVTSENYDMAKLASNRNSFYNAAGALTFKDNSVGTMTYADWKKTYKLDKQSLRKDPKLELSHPNKKKYLHLKKKSPLINKGSAILNFNNDAVMQKRLQEDWDGEKRPHKNKPDIGLDEKY